ncbi:hypothetical protein ACWDOP_14335 [Nocardia sp. NPDC003693]
MSDPATNEPTKNETEASQGARHEVDERPTAYYRLSDIDFDS